LSSRFHIEGVLNYFLEQICLLRFSY
jgi:hypothetical protein